MTEEDQDWLAAAAAVIGCNWNYKPRPGGPILLHIRPKLTNASKDVATAFAS